MNHLDAKNNFDAIWNNISNRHYRIQPPIEGNKSCVDEKSLFAALEIEKTDLNAVKSLLNTVDILAWHQHTKNMHPFSNISMKLRNHIKAELPTQAWAKFYCILWNYDLIKEPSEGNIFRSVHLCEAPGAFITSLNHFLKSNFGSDFQWDWLGTTLNPYYEGNELGKMIPDDRFIINTLDKWYFGADYTGNIMNLNNLDGLKEKLKDQNVDLVTADGSIDCSDDPGEQEQIVTPLLVWEILTALHILSNGGSFVVKMFTVFEQSTVLLLFLLASVFEEIEFFKPGPSKPGNSEVYLVARGFDPKKCFEMKLFNDLQDVAVKEDIGLIKNLVDFSKLSKDFVQSIRDYVEESCSLQKAAIQINRKAFQQMTSKDEDRLQKMKIYFTKRFINEYSIKRIQEYASPMFKVMLSQGQYKNTKQHMSYKKGSLEQRQSNQKKRFKSTDDIPQSFSSSPSVDWYGGLDIPLCKIPPPFRPIVGKDHDKISSSLFCNPGTLESLCNHDSKQGCQIKIVFPKQVDSFYKVFSQSKWFVISDDIDFKESVETHRELLHNNDEEFEDTTFLVDLQILDIEKDCKKSKLQIITAFLSTMKKGQHNVCFHFHKLLLSSFWVGLFQLLSSLYKDVAYHCPEHPHSCLFFLCAGYKGDINSWTNVQHFMEECLQALDEVRDGMNLLHILPLQQVMSSDFRQYVKTCNNTWISERFVSTTFVS